MPTGCFKNEKSVRFYLNGVEEAENIIQVLEEKVIREMRLRYFPFKEGNIA